jgi:hypothetical protein
LLRSHAMRDTLSLSIYLPRLPARRLEREEKGKARWEKREEITGMEINKGRAIKKERESARFATRPHTRSTTFGGELSSE